MPLIQKLQAIVDPHHKIEFPPIHNPWLLDVLQQCLHRDPKLRPPITGAGGLLSHPFLNPNTCQPPPPLSPAGADGRISLSLNDLAKAINKALRLPEEVRASPKQLERVIKVCPCRSLHCAVADAAAIPQTLYRQLQEREELRRAQRR